MTNKVFWFIIILLLVYLAVVLWEADWEPVRNYQFKVYDQITEGGK